MHDVGMPQPGMFTNRRRVRAGHVHREQFNSRLLIVRQRTDPLVNGLLPASRTDPNRLARLEVADNRDELALAHVSATEVLLVNADHLQFGLLACGVPPLEGALLRPTHRVPVDAVRHRHV